MPDVFYGQNSNFDMISRTHGRKTLGFVESFEIDVSHSNKRLYFFGKKEAFALSIFEGVSGRFGYLATDEKFLTALLMDVNPDAAVVNDDPAAYQEFRLRLNINNEQGILSEGVLVKGCRVAGNPTSLAPREERHGQLSYIGATRYSISGGGILYSRIVRTPPAFSTPDDIVLADVAAPAPYVAALAQEAELVNIADPATTRNWLAIYKNGDDISYNATAMTGITVTTVLGVTSMSIPNDSFATTDVYEIFTVYKP